MKKQLYSGGATRQRAALAGARSETNAGVAVRPAAATSTLSGRRAGSGMVRMATEQEQEEKKKEDIMVEDTPTTEVRSKKERKKKMK